MISMIVVFIVFVVVYMVRWKKSDRWGKYTAPRALTFSILAGGLLAAVTPLLLFIPVGLIFGEELGESEKHEIVYTVELQQIDDTTLISGSSLLTIGSIEEELYYFGYVKTSSGRFKAEKWSMDDYEVRYDTGQPRVEHVKTVEAAFDGWLCKVFVCEIYLVHPVEKIIYVPEGSVEQDYSLEGLK